MQTFRLESNEALSIYIAYINKIMGNFDYL